MKYDKLEMRKYLSSKSCLTLQEKKETFKIRTRRQITRINMLNTIVLPVKQKKNTLRKPKNIFITVMK